MSNPKAIPRQIRCRDNDIRNSSFFHNFFSQVILNMFSQRESIQLMASMYTMISERVIRWLGGSWSFMLGIKAMKPSTIVAIVPTFYAGLALQKNRDILKMANMMMGMKMVAHALPGNLQTGITKCEYSQYANFWVYFFQTFDIFSCNLYEPCLFRDYMLYVFCYMLLLQRLYQLFLGCLPSTYLTSSFLISSYVAKLLGQCTNFFQARSQTPNLHSETQLIDIFQGFLMQLKLIWHLYPLKGESYEGMNIEFMVTVRTRFRISKGERNTSSYICTGKTSRTMNFKKFPYFFNFTFAESSLTASWKESPLLTCTMIFDSRCCLRSSDSPSMSKMTISTQLTSAIRSLIQIFWMDLILSETYAGTKSCTFFFLSSLSMRMLLVKLRVFLLMYFRLYMGSSYRRRLKDYDQKPWMLYSYPLLKSLWSRELFSLVSFHFGLIYQLYFRSGVLAAELMKICSIQQKMFNSS